MVCIASPGHLLLEIGCSVDSPGADPGHSSLVQWQGMNVVKVLNSNNMFGGNFGVLLGGGEVDVSQNWANS